MPTDPATGEKLPYPEDEEKKKEGAAPEEGEEMSFEQDIKPVLDAADAILAEDEAPVEDAPVEENAEGVDLSPIEEALGIDSAAAAELWEAAQDRDDLAMLTPEELGAKLADDFGLRMQLEKSIAAKADAGMEEMMPMEEMPVGGPEGTMPPGM